MISNDDAIPAEPCREASRHHREKMLCRLGPAMRIGVEGRRKRDLPACFCALERRAIFSGRVVNHTYRHLLRCKPKLQTPRRQTRLRPPSRCAQTCCPTVAPNNYRAASHFETTSRIQENNWAKTKSVARLTPKQGRLSNRTPLFGGFGRRHFGDLVVSRTRTKSVIRVTHSSSRQPRLRLCVSH